MHSTPTSADVISVSPLGYNPTPSNTVSDGRRGRAFRVSVNVAPAAASAVYARGVSDGGTGADADRRHFLGVVAPFDHQSVSRPSVKVERIMD